jgi:hypothetical protein
MDPALSMMVRDYFADATRCGHLRREFEKLNQRMLDDIGVDDPRRSLPSRGLWSWLSAPLRANLARTILPERPSSWGA